MEADEPKLIHRDDIPMEDAEAIVESLQDMFPGMRVQFAGDMPPDQLPEGLVQAAERLAREQEKMLFEGRCIDCKRQMENWPAESEDMADDWQPPKGWRWFTNTATGEQSAWQCPGCDAKED